MKRATSQQLDAFADAIADGLPVRRAALRAGYSPLSKSVYLWVKRPDFIARVERRRARREPASAADLEPIIERLLAAADRAAEAEPDAALLRAMRELLVEAARLKQLLPAPEAGGAADYEMNREAWLATYGPKAGA